MLSNKNVLKVSNTGSAYAEANGWANSGHVENLTVVVNETFRPQWPLLVGPLPPPASRFVPRDASSNLREWIESAKATPSTVVLRGMGGTGKTQVATEFAADMLAKARADVDSASLSTSTQHADPVASSLARIDLVVWVTADRIEHIVSTYARAWRAVTGQLPLGDADGEAASFLSWLATTPRHWLVILDDVPDVGTLRDWWPPRTASGRCVVTTRSNDAAWHTEHRVCVDVGLYSRATSRRYLQSVLGPKGLEHDPTHLGRLADDLGHLPLALAQAAAYLCEDHSLTIERYRDLLADRTLHLTDVLPEDSSLPDAQQHTVAAAWHLSVQRANELAPAGVARPLLTVLCLLDTHAVPTAMLSTPALLKYLDTQQPSGRQRPTSAHHATRALRVLRRLNLVTPAPRGTDDQDDLISMHQLVQRAVRESAQPSELNVAVRAAADALEETWPPGVHYADTVVGRALMSSAACLIAHDTADALWDEQGPHRVLTRLGLQLQGTGRRHQGLLHYKSMLRTARRQLGDNHPGTLLLRSDIACLQAEDGDVSAAVRELRAVLAVQRRLLGDEHSHVLTTLNNLAHWRGMAGDHAGAVAEYDRLLNTLRRLSAPAEEDILATRRNRAHYMTRCGRESEALPELRAVVKGTMRISGPRHPRTMAARNALASCLGLLGHHKEAIEILTLVLADQHEVHGELHAEVLITRCNLAQQRGRAGHHGQAITELTELVPLFAAVFGPDQTRTLTCRAVLAHWTWRAGEKETARAQMENVADHATRALGLHHPLTTDACQTLGHWSADGGTWAEQP
ncbi:tetratricopeptide repeat protein [Streptomyces sp. NPDC091972]|uniref:tetratricopeptide repeat protein n=1 Tax=Streptomyces sp. NPDC091972 TaxID=3366007 RepID=UPI00380B34C6